MRLRSLPCTIAIALAGIPGWSARAEPPRYPDTMPIDQIHAGMHGYGLTVFRGTKIDRFEVTVVGVVKKGSWVAPGHDMVLVRLSGGPITARGAFKIQGMSGSPVYINGKIIGAFSQAESMEKEPLGGVTPIEDMLEAWDPKLPDTPLAALDDNAPRSQVVQPPIRLASRTIDRIVFNAPHASWSRSHGSTLVLQHCSTALAVSSRSPAARAKLAALLQPYDVEVVQGPGTSGQTPDFKGAPLVPGAAFSMMLSVGDVTMGAIGTVTYRRGDRILGFGHPFMTIGPIEAPLCSAYIHDVYPLITASYKIGSPGPVVGSSLQDRSFSISGIVGRSPNLIPVTVAVNDHSSGRSRVFHTSTVSHPNLSAALVSVAAESAVAEVHGTPGPLVARVTTTVDAEEVGRVTRTNTVFDARAIDAASTSDLDEILAACSSNPFYPLAVKSASLKVDIDAGRPTAQVERVFLKEGRFEPGQIAEVGIVVKPYRKPAFVRTVKVAIPQNAPSGAYTLLVRGGAAPPAISFGGIVIRSAGNTFGEQAPPSNVRQIMNRIVEREKSTEIVVRLVLPSLSINVDGEKLNALPPSLEAVMRSARSSGIRLERDEVRVVEPTDWIVSGTQSISLNVLRRSLREGAGASPSAGPPPLGQMPPPQPASAVDTEVDASSSDGDASDTTPEDQTGSMLRASVQNTLGARPNRKRGAVDRAEKAGPDTATAAAAMDTSKDDHQAGAQIQEGGRETPVVRLAHTWRQTGRGDLSRGHAVGMAVSSSGDLALTRTLKLLRSSREGFVWCIVPDGSGGLIAGAGMRGKVLHFPATGDTSVLATLPEVSVHAVLRDPDGTVWAATGPHGRVYRIRPDGKSVLALQTSEKYALAMARDSHGNIYVATGGGSGKVYRLAPDGHATVVLPVADDHILCLSVGDDDAVYAGSAPDGVLYRIAPDGKASVLYNVPEQSITGVAATNHGVYACTAPRGVVYCVSPAGVAKTVYDKATAAFTGICTAGPDRLYAASGSSVYRIGSDGTVAALYNSADVDMLSLTADAQAGLYAGTGNGGDVYVIDRPTEAWSGRYESVVHDARMSSRWGSIQWNVDVPAGSHFDIRTRSGDVADPDSTWTGWSAPAGLPGDLRITSPSARFIQYCVTMTASASGESPSLRDISISYLPKNQPPHTSFVSPTTGDRWSGRQTIRWEASDPDRDTLAFELYYSMDNGSHWNPLPGANVHAAASDTAQGTESTKPAIKPDASGPGPYYRPPTVEEVQAQLDKHSDMPVQLREAILARVRESVTDYDARPTATPQPLPAVAAAATRETSRPLDTAILPDGRYRLKVVASDRPSNGQDALSNEAISESFVVCNAPPLMVIAKSGLQVEPDRTVRIEGIALQRLIGVAAVQFRVDGGEWTAASASDGIFDSDLESFSVVTPGLPLGHHTVEVKTFSSAGKSTTQKIEVEVK